MKILIGKGEKYLVKNKKINTPSGIIKINKAYGVVKSHLGVKFIVANATITDLIEKLKRGPQVILPKDLGLIIAYTGLRPNWKILDAGTGSGYAAIFLANLVPKGKVISYEKDERFYKLAKENISMSHLKNIKLKKGNITKSKIEKNFDLALLDLKDVVKALPRVFNALKLGGWLAVYSPTVDELLKVNKKIKALPVVEHKIIEGIVREWQYEKTLRPKTKGIVHTGFITLVRKFV